MMTAIYTEANNQTTLFADNPQYDDFVDKFKPTKTTDDCYTPPLVYDAVKGWACREYNIDPALIVRPFFPGGDYKRFDYSGGKVVLDNPPFSLLAEIQEFYLARGIPFFLFAPSLTAFSSRRCLFKTCHIICDANITYDNGAVVRTAFITSFSPEIVARTAPDLREKIEDAVKKVSAAKGLPKYEYPDHLLTAAAMQKLSRYGINYAVSRDHCVFVPALDSQRQRGKAIFGGGLLLSERAAAERAAAERAAVERWSLSQREIDIIKQLGD